MTVLFVACALLLTGLANALRVPITKSSSFSGSRSMTSTFATGGGRLQSTHIRTPRCTQICMSAADGIRPLKIIIAGAPASGKGTQCEVIKADYNVVHLSTGDILRAAVKAGSELGAEAKSYMDSGNLVPDELITGVVCDRLSQPDCEYQGWLLDGFPRTSAQAEALSRAGYDPDAFILLDVPQQCLVERVTGRRTDPETGKIYHTTVST